MELQEFTWLFNLFIFKSTPSFEDKLVMDCFKFSNLGLNPFGRTSNSVVTSISLFPNSDLVSWISFRRSVIISSILVDKLAMDGRSS